MGGMELDTVKTRLTGSAGGGHKVATHLAQFVGRKLARHASFTDHYRRNGNTLKADCGINFRSCMMKLHERDGPIGMNGICQP